MAASSTTLDWTWPDRWPWIDLDKITEITFGKMSFRIDDIIFYVSRSLPVGELAKAGRRAAKQAAYTAGEFTEAGAQRVMVNPSILLLLTVPKIRSSPLSPG